MNRVMCYIQHLNSYVIINQKRNWVCLVNRAPLWLVVTAIFVIVVAITSFISDAPYFEILNTLGLIVLMVSLGTFARGKNKARAYTFFGLSAFLVIVLAFQFLTL
jgi:hypothetical protein